MAHFYRLAKRLDEVSSEFFEMTQAANDHKQAEMDAIVRVQAVYRASKVRVRWNAVRAAVHMIQRVCRGMLGRSRAKATRLVRIRRLNSLFFHHCAAVIQKFFRGHWSRKYLHDYYGRKKYLETVAKRGEWTQAYLQHEQQQNAIAAKEMEEREMRQEFDSLAGDLHHLVSTKSIPGVYNPPYNDALPRAFDKPIEQHLRDALHVRLPRSLRRPRHKVLLASSSPRAASGYGPHPEHGVRTGMEPPAGPPQDLPDRNPYRSRSASVGRMQKIQGPFRSREQIEVANVKAANVYRSIQASGSYNAVEQDKKMQQRLSKLSRVSPMDFVPAGNDHTKLPPSSVHASVPYRERAVDLRSDYVELPKIREKPPFFTAMPRDKHFHDYEEGPLLPNSFV
eukprot:gnl/TRDRNA2_/TRDRNA2_192130_c0_seq1.p1 gnl/TRDRNA2_/TRDRNA2_192130_c0~~gnl/TRDRNA2_/TRDRNA2_192130_c0_seq1.p1  ORF type:complete len:394 (+),score=62.44 gnl/TRDRNA2_/TRDRNA2_192130_c0_seq1:121-1302(+)